MDRFAGNSEDYPKADLSDTKKRFDYGDRSDFAVIDQKSGKGAFFFVTSLFGTESYSKRRGLVMAEDAYASLERGYQTGRATIGSAAGSPEVPYKRLREFLWDRYCVMRGKPMLVDYARVSRAQASGDAAMLYVGGSDCNVQPAAPVTKGADWVTALSRCASLCDGLRKPNKDAIICLSAQAPVRPSHAHLLNTFDQIEVSRGAERGCLASRRQRYNQAFVFPLRAMNAGLRGEGPELPFPQAKYEIISSLSDHPRVQGGPQASVAGPELSAYLSRFSAFLKRFEPYFEAYQHVLDFPDGKSIDGEGHIIANKGFILLFNPTDQPRKITLPLAEPELELRGELKLTDWAELGSGTPMGTAKPKDTLEVELGPVSARIIGVNI